jgi:hypothetical protein
MLRGTAPNNILIYYAGVTHTLPGVSAGTMNIDILLWAWALGSVTASTRKNAAYLVGFVLMRQ